MYTTTSCSKLTLVGFILTSQFSLIYKIFLHQWESWLLNQPPSPVHLGLSFLGFGLSQGSQRGRGAETEELQNTPRSRWSLGVKGCWGCSFARKPHNCKVTSYHMGRGLGKVTYSKSHIHNRFQLLHNHPPPHPFFFFFDQQFNRKKRNKMIKKYPH